MVAFYRAFVAAKYPDESSRLRCGDRPRGGQVPKDRYSSIKRSSERPLDRLPLVIVTAVIEANTSGCSRTLHTAPIRTIDQHANLSGSSAVKSDPETFLRELDSFGCLG